MSSTPARLKHKLHSIIKACEATKDDFVHHPGIDFTRKSKLSFIGTLHLMFSLYTSTLSDHITTFFDDNTSLMPSTPAFVKRRDLLKPELFEHIFHTFTDSLANDNTYNGYRICLIDGTKLPLPHNKKCDAYIHYKSNKHGYNQLHLNLLYDQTNAQFLDYHIQLPDSEDERKACIKLMSHIPEGSNTIFIADRGYESYTICAHVTSRSNKFLFRIKDVNSTGLLSGLTLPSEDSFDTAFKLTLTRSAKDLECNVGKDPNTERLFKCLSRTTTLDFMTEETPHFDLDFRIVRVIAPNGKPYIFMTNLSENDLDKSALLNLYHKRWEIETAIDTLKNKLHLESFHAKKMPAILMEIAIRLTLFNFDLAIIRMVKLPLSHTRYHYRVNTAQAVRILRRFLFAPPHKYPDLLTLLAKYTEAVKPGRYFERDKIKHGWCSFGYR